MQDEERHSPKDKTQAEEEPSRHDYELQSQDKKIAAPRLTMQEEERHPPKNKMQEEEDPSRNDYKLHNHE